VTEVKNSTMISPVEHHDPRAGRVKRAHRNERHKIRLCSGVRESDEVYGWKSLPNRCCKRPLVNIWAAKREPSVSCLRYRRSDDFVAVPVKAGRIFPKKIEALVAVQIDEAVASSLNPRKGKWRVVNRTSRAATRQIFSGMRLPFSASWMAVAVSLHGVIQRRR
jgi:hypothetical protein